MVLVVLIIVGVVIVVLIVIMIGAGRGRGLGQHHPGEKVKRMKDGTIDYRVRLSGLDEIARWVIGFGGMAKVVKPKELHDQVVAMARNVVDGRKW